jgi:hypothetical protein
MEVQMSEAKLENKLHDGTLIRHKVAGYEGRIEGTTEIKSCFTRGGELLVHPTIRDLFQYRVIVEGESLRRIAPAEDLEILEAVVEIICHNCHRSFQTKPQVVGKPRGRCQCGGWICPSCLTCHDLNDASAKGGPSRCTHQKKRVAKLAQEKKAAAGSRVGWN